jgi:hypothetical protein
MEDYARLYEMALLQQESIALMEELAKERGMLINCYNRRMTS